MQQAETSALEQIRQQLGDAFLRGRAPHAILLEGGETDALAAWISAAAVCTNAQKRPCGECAGCKKAFGGIHPDIHTASGSGDASADTTTETTGETEAGAAETTAETEAE